MPCFLARQFGRLEIAFAVISIFASLLFAFPLAAAPNGSERFPLDQIGAVLGRQYQGEGLSVAASPEGVRLKCVFHKLEGQATPEGLWLTSTTDTSRDKRFRVSAVEVRRAVPAAPHQGVQALGPLPCPSWLQPLFPAHSVVLLAAGGTVQVTGNLVRFARPGLIEEYSVSVDGLRQDFLVLEPPALDSQSSTLNQPVGPLRLELSVTGARVEPRADGARLVLEGSGRKIAYNRLRATDATGKELPARIEVQPPSAFGLQSLALSLLVDDSAALYPIRIDPTFSDDNWISTGGLPGANGVVRAAVTDAAGDLYIGGDFNAVGDIIANRIAKWNGTNWAALGEGLNGTVYALAVSGSDLYVGGSFTYATNVGPGSVQVNRIAKWDGSSWSALGAGLNNTVNALAGSGTDLYVGGSFSYATNAGPGTVQVNGISKWDGSSWSALGSGVIGFVNALAVSGSDLYIGGHFTTGGGSGANYVAKWDGSSWSALGSGLDSDVTALAVSGSDLYVGGWFWTAGGTSAQYVAKWDGSNWSPLGSGVSGHVNALAVSGSDLYVSGDFTTAGGTAARYVAKWNKNGWSALGSGASATVYALAVSGSDLYVGGGFMTAGESGANHVAKWNGSSWSVLGSGLNNTVYALAVSGSDLCAGGDTASVMPPPPPPLSIRANLLAQWNGSGWSDLGLGLNGTVYALALSGSNLYVGGSFTYATNAGPTTVQVNGVAKWNGSGWSALGSGLRGSYPFVRALALSGSDLYVGGYFTAAGGSAANCIAKWDGTSWSALGRGLDAQVYALAVSGSDLYVGGQFHYATNAGPSTIPVNGIAKWNGTSWSPLGSGLNSTVYALAVSGSDLYVGGFFTWAGGSPASRVAKWNGSSWLSLGSGLNYTVYALAVSGSDLYVGGYFTTAGGSPANCIAKWDGSGWSPLGSGLNGTVYALAVSGTNLYAGGSFTTVGGKVSAYVAKANINAAGGRFTSLSWSLATGFSCVFSDATLGQPYRIQTSPSLAPSSWTDLTNVTYAAPITINDPSSLTAAPRYYRAVWNP